MIQLFSGIPGCGKTYRAVFELVKAQGKYYVFHNISGLKQEKIENGEFIQTIPGRDEFNTFFSLENQTALSESVKEKYKRSMLIIIDEAQVPLGRFNANVKEWMAYHRHLGQDIWLITHDKMNIDKSYHSLIEIEIKGKKGFIFNSFIYSFIVSGERVKSDRLPKKQEIFDLYESFTVEETHKKKSSLFVFMAVMGAIALGLGTYAFFFRMPSSFQKNTDKQNQNKVQTPGSGSPVAPVASTEIEYTYIGDLQGKMLVADPSGNVWFLDQVTGYSETFISNKNGSALVMDQKANSKIMRYKPIRGGGGGAGRATSTAPSGSTPADETYVLKRIIIK